MGVPNAQTSRSAVPGSPFSPIQSVHASWTMHGVTPFQGTVAADGIMLTASPGNGHV